MRIRVKCYQNDAAFGVGSPLWFDASDAERVFLHPLRHVVTLFIEAENTEDAANIAFAIGNAPDSPADACGKVWPHEVARSMSTGDVVVCTTSSGTQEAYVCMAMGWQAVAPWKLSLA